MENELRSPKAGRVKDVAVTARHVGRGRARARRDRMSECDRRTRSLPPEQPDAEPPAPAAGRRRRRRSGASIRFCGCSAILVALVAAVIVTFVDHRPRTAADEDRRDSRARSSSIARCTSASSSIVLRNGSFKVDDLVIEGLKPTDRPFLKAKTRLHEPAVVDVLHPRADRRERRHDRLGDARRAVPRQAQLPEARAARRSAQGAVAVLEADDDGPLGHRAQRPVHLRRPHHAVDGGVPQSERQRLQGLRHLPRHRAVHATAP